MFIMFILLWIFCTVMMILGTIKPSLALLPFAKKGRGKAFISWFMIGLFCFIVELVITPSDDIVTDNISSEISESVIVEEHSVTETSSETITTENEENKKTEIVTSEVELKEKYLVGEVATLDNTLVQVIDVVKSNGSDFDNPKDGMEYIIISIAINNKGSREISYNTYDFEMANSKGQLTDPAISIIDTETSLSSGNLLPNGFVEGTMVFEQPVDDTALTLVYTPSFWDDANVKFDVMNAIEGFEKLEAGIVEVKGTVYPVGEYAVLDDAKMKVVSIDKSNGSDYDKPKAGMEYIVITIEINNTGDDNLSYNPYYFSMINSKGQVSDQTFSTIDTDTSLESGELLSGGIVEGTIVFEQPINDTGLYLQYEDVSWFSDGTLLFVVSE